ncbi:MAG: hypothetical protein A3G33_02395 [Omnitrophica bacterium RIFCSPLOWO2_12_FULL_44_17]|uniref:ACT domain-containing protein n=1 Tax=Candidatus Danuiimicrobium aquiferis TaxID=1801832 RepID=A0A1G1L1X4_9BACT|nr:MAG: hypothetical protein A3B72_01975 [Omnitrophica bacterium RIFCSPHIGHO2_02_FULL_45_28]OGW90482.1 MAG: hypothetical protein A3E74_03275 [Omnitrophica bacterium RIFCSPHIGHO2_12_FULL_44_12]OGW98889.1 MAG: hypothetical protein A3G33_02395 [Omnitrophica bacterium RIFCSPLOWO2_12_FULL_44_17]OGX02014.1 MAG: hypothetical protein A3J12_11395 [Omnitrophica bacterium RIFCSPLOWO2_02_FULL_44_11]
MPNSVIVEAISEGQTRIKVVLPDAVGLLSVITGHFSSYSMNIIRAEIDTSEKMAIDIFDVTAKAMPDWNRFEKELLDYSHQIQAGNIKDVRAEINKKIIAHLRTHQDFYLKKLYPIDLTIDQKSSPNETIVNIKSQDTPAFLYELTNALSLLGFNICRMEVETIGSEVRDRIWITTETGEKVTEEGKLKSLQWAILMIKQCTHYLPQVPDPAQALDKIVLLGKDIFQREDFDTILLSFQKSQALENLSKVLGSSRFLWEEFIRFQHESILKILGEPKSLTKRKGKPVMAGELRSLLSDKHEFRLKVQALNEYKDQEMFRIDLRHLLGKTSYLEEFAEEFTDLVEVVVEITHELAWAETLKKLPHPMVSETEKSCDSIFALGKFGGRELGYASDVELLFVYSDDPDFMSERSRRNLAFYTELVQLFLTIVHAKAKGVFEMDLRLRPFGDAGPLATSVELFKNYYSPKGEARNFERQAFIKLRPVIGPEWLIDDVKCHRDEFVFGGRPFDYADALELRNRQRKELVEKNTVNAKYSAGGLLDIEYLIQSVQIEQGGKQEGDIRTPNTLKAIAALQAAGVFDEKMVRSLKEAYVFLRNLINSLRIVRGNAKDLNIPAYDSMEFTMLARRCGYSGNDEAIRKKLKQDCDQYMRTASELYERELNRLIQTYCSKADVEKVREISTAGLEMKLEDVLSAEVPARILLAFERLGFSEVEEAIQRFKRFCGNSAFLPVTKSVIDPSWAVWNDVPDPDMALKHFERFYEQHENKQAFWEVFTKNPQSLSILLKLFGASRYLSELLIYHSEDWDWVRDAKNFSAEDIQKSLEAIRPVLMNAEMLRRVRHRETLRIALADLIANQPIESISKSFSQLADRMIEKALREAYQGNSLGVVGLGKLGGGELNFSSDIDLIFLSDDGAFGEDLSRAIQSLIKLLSAGGPDEFLYRVDLRLRPHGNAGSIFLSKTDSSKYYRDEADAWEFQAWLKARAVSGNRILANSLIAEIVPLIYRKEWPNAALDRLRVIKRRYEEETAAQGDSNRHVKMGIGCIRDIEFSIQMIQLLKGYQYPELQTGNSLAALREIERLKLLNAKDCGQLREGYEFLRRIENRLQLFENRQVFSIPKDKNRLNALARSLGFRGLGKDSEADRFLNEYDEVRERCRLIFERVFYQQVIG